MPWLVLFLFCVAVGLPNVILEENVGCLFSDRLCLENEWCFDDYAFGRCLSSTDINNDDLYRYDLNKGELNKISSELRRLFTLGYRWSHLYTQCRLQAILYSIRYDTSFDNNACTHLVDQDLEGALNALENDDTINPDEIAIVKYAPNSEHSNSNFADEIYYPPVDNISIRDNNILPHDAVIDLHELENPYVGIDKRDEWIPQMHRRSSSLEFLNQDPIINNDKQNYEDIQYLLDALQLKQNDNPYWNFPEQRIYDQGDNDEINNNEYGSGFNEIFRERQNPMIYTEGGTVQMKTQDRNKFYDNFKRMERLDVKKPGPQISQTLMKLIKNDDTFVPSMIKKEPRGVHPNPFHDLYSDVDTDYVYVKFQNSLNTWKEGEYIIANISRLLHLESTAFTYGRVDRNEVTFKVVPNSRGFNSSEVARRIEFISDKLEEKTGVKVIAAGIGNRNKMQSIVVTKLDQVENEYYVIIFLVAGVLGATILAAVFLILIKKTIRNRIKLSGLSRPESEAGKDYQDLCRARMATKNDPVGRITCLSKESESSRSSTSSWSEEPALNNMDISTGHMVLSYMEDHLKNKDRLDQEWVALCAYIAEPCETTIALKKENISKNRYKDIIPYDHSRVVLNELSNGSNSDYINASTITDHDPRNPAYIATQGPLTHTCPDFWQMIWEQGAVVIVMLTRLTEGGTTMCHRYWPEEGSELYNIYEVHLVSEHIWCDDYLVRSFYLKNVKTSETRTVTQFHFLSWPESGIPASTKALLEFRRKVNKSYRGRSSPIVVHCNDGTGRSGTYCLIDMVLSRMAKGAKEIDIAATLEHLRDQRLKMVANKQQFEFVLTAVAEEVHAILKALPPQPTFTQTDK